MGEDRSRDQQQREVAAQAEEDRGGKALALNFQNSLWGRHRADHLAQY